MLDFKAKMHQIRFRLRELTALPRPLAGLRGPTSKERGGEGREGVRWGGEGKRGEQGRREGEGRPPNVRDALTPLMAIHALCHCETETAQVVQPLPTHNAGS